MLEAERDYARKPGLCLPLPACSDSAALSAFREAILARLTPEPKNNIDESKNPWPLPCAARRIAWHALDHAWEIEDRR